MRDVESKVKIAALSAGELHYVLSDKLLQRASGFAGHGLDRIGDG